MLLKSIFIGCISRCSYSTFHTHAGINATSNNKQSWITLRSSLFNHNNLYSPTNHVSPAMPVQHSESVLAGQGDLTRPPSTLPDSAVSSLLPSCHQRVSSVGVQGWVPQLTTPLSRYCAAAACEYSICQQQTVDTYNSMAYVITGCVHHVIHCQPFWLVLLLLQ